MKVFLFYQLEASETEMEEKVFMLQENQKTKTQELEEALESVEELKLTLSKQKAAIEKGKTFFLKVVRKPF